MVKGEELVFEKPSDNFPAFFYMKNCSCFNVKIPIVPILKCESRYGL